MVARSVVLYSSLRSLACAFLYMRVCNEPLRGVTFSWPSDLNFQFEKLILAHTGYVRDNYL